MPNRQVLERRPIRGSIEPREFEYTRHGTVCILKFLVVHTGEMEATCLGSNSAERYIPALEQSRQGHRELRGAFLIHDGGASHIARDTAGYFAGCNGWWRPRLTPAHASWLNQAETLDNTIDGRYLKRGSRTSREEYTAHVAASWPEYKRHCAHSSRWTWTNQKMRNWFARNAH